MKNIYFVGAPTIEKGLQDYNNIAKEITNVNFFWYCYKIDKKIIKHYKYINFIVGLDDQKLIKNITKKMDLFMCCSHYEGFCLPIAEAMRLKKPVISYALDEIKSEFKNNIEYAENLDELKCRIKDLISLNNYHVNLNNAKSFIEINFSPEKVTKRLLNILN